MCVFSQENSVAFSMSLQSYVSTIVFQAKAETKLT